MFRSVNSFFKMIFSSAEQNSLRPKVNFYNKGYTPSYLFIEKDLESTKPQIFEAAVYYLCTIASLRKACRAEIVDMLHKAASQNKIHAAYIEKVMQEKKLI